MSEETRQQTRGEDILPPGTLLAERYEIVEFLAEGGMGRVYIALQRPIQRKVALKVMRRELVFDNSSKKRFLREALAVSKLTHPNTITIIDYGDQQELCFIAMEFLDGVSLDQLLREGPMSIDRAVNIVGQIARSLSEAHRKGVIHRDLKPENIFICEVDGTPDFVKVLDFGIARIQLGDGDGVTRITREGYVCGTPEYMSPEQARGDEVDGRTDIYALGVMFWELLEGKVPYEAPTPLGTVLKHQSEPVPELTVAVPEALKRFIYRTMSKSREDRPDSAEAFLDELLSACPEGLRIGDESFNRSGRQRSITPRTPSTPMRQTDMEVAMAPTQAMPASGVEAEVDTADVPIPPPEYDTPRSPRGLMIASLAAAVVFSLAAVVALFVFNSPSDAPPEPAAPVVAANAANAAANEAPEANPTSPPPAKVASTRLMVAGAPMDAVIVQGGAELGPAPRSLTGQPGEAVTVTVQKEGFEPQTLEGSFPADGEKALRYTLKRVARVISEPEGATVHRGEESLGSAPVSVTWAPGESVELRLTLDGHQEQVVTVTDDTSEELTVALKAAERVAVGRPRTPRRPPNGKANADAATTKTPTEQAKPKEVAPKEAKPKETKPKYELVP